jgi:hypothetical protein
VSLFSRRPKRYWSEDAHRRNVENQVRMAPSTLTELAKLGVTPQSELKLEFFFYTDAPAKAASLATDLAHLGYQAQHGLAAADNGQSVVTGWTTPMPMSKEGVVAWTRQMCTLGFDHDCEFDGWGTTPEQ